MRDSLMIDVALTPEDSAVKAQALLTMHGLMSQDPALAPIYGITNKYSVITRAMDLMGLKNPAYISNPESPQVQQQIMQQSQQQQEQKQMQEQITQMQMQLAKFGEETKRLRVTLEAEHKAEQLELDATTEADDQALEEQQFEHEKVMDYAELAVEVTQERPASL